MKKVNFAFVPGASPTYVPLGIASLIAYVQSKIPGLEVNCVDLSIHFWHRMLSRDEEGRRCMQFFKADSDGFYESDRYTDASQVFARYQGEWQNLTLSITLALRHHSVAENDWYEAVLFEALHIGEEEILLLSAAYPDQLIHAVQIAGLVKRRFPKVTVILGGSALPAICPEEILRAAPHIDRVYMGEGEEGLVQFLTKVTADARGWAYLKDDIMVTGKRPRGIDMRQLSEPDFSSLQVSERFSPATVLPVSFSRGCRWRKCAFCSHNFGFAGYRVDTYARFVDHIEILKHKHNTAYFYFTDQYIDAASLEGISREIQKRRLNIRFHVMGRPTIDYTEETLGLLFDAGCRWISWGVESGAQSLLDSCNKGTRVTDVAEVLRRSHHAGINNLAMMVFGLPDTNADAFQQTLDFAEEVSAFVDAFTDSSFQLFEKTPFYRQADAFGIKVLEKEKLFSVGERPVHSHRRGYALTSALSEQVQSPAGAAEVALWKRWKSWVRSESIFESLPAEHYLLFADRHSRRPVGNSY